MYETWFCDVLLASIGSLPYAFHESHYNGSSAGGQP